MILVVLLASFLLAVPHVARSDGNDRGALIAVTTIGVGLLRFAAWLGAEARRSWDPRRSPVVDLIVRRPHDLAWFYVLRQTRHGMTLALSVIFRLADGRHLEALIVADDEEAVFDEISRHAPHAARGYSPEHDAQYRENPARWRP